MKYKLFKFIVKFLLKDNLKHLLNLAISTRIDYLSKLRIENKFVDCYNISEDIKDLGKLSNCFEIIK